MFAPSYHRACAVCLFALGCVLDSRVAAQTQSVAAEALFRAGRQAAERGDHATACAKFRESYRVEAAIGTLLNIAICEEAQGLLSSAWQHFQEVSHALPDDDRRLMVAHEHLTTLEDRVPRLTIALGEAAPPDTSARIDEVQLSAASFGTPLPLDPGIHTVLVNAHQHATRRYDITLVEGAHASLTIEPGQILQPDARLPQAHAHFAPADASALAVTRSFAPMNMRLGVGYALLGAAGLGLVTGGVAVGFVVDRAATVSTHCNARLCDPQGLDAGAQGKVFYATSWVALATAVVAGVAGGMLLLRANPDGDTASAWRKGAQWSLSF